VSYAKNFLDNSDIKICTVVSFPEGTDKTQEKDELYESENLAATSIGCSNPNDSTEAVE
jgi:deoxyribose-phosphate aldolase